MLRTRVLSALILLPIVAWVVWAGSWWLFGAVLLVAALAGREYTQLMRRGGYAPATVFVLAVISIAILDAQFPAHGIALPALTWMLVLSISWQLFQSQDQIPTTNWALSIAGGLYLGWLSSHLIRLRAIPDGLAWTIIALLVTWAGDTGAYFVGNAIGRHKLWPRLSPRKTWEGLLGGVISSLVVGALVGYLAMQWRGAIGFELGLSVGLLGAVVGPFGDLTISMMKRQVNAKDSSQLIPGHGGVLDRIDSLLFVITATYYCATWLAG